MQDLLLQMKKGRSLQKLLGTELTAFLVMNKLPEKYTFVYSQNHLGLTHGLFPKEHVWIYPSQHDAYEMFILSILHSRPVKSDLHTVVI